ncbi:MAG: 2-oxoglutarate dehydrogenase complex dihydrolipoyllysine-residue succinyltransferase [Desulfobacteraceae bacterium]|nr:MAG: 2-oxoglutarate dehydrogenase complex dihydrolipoyllysine-residue succinyltransferase [Desulfobacteraceae bacterium]
MAIEIKVPSVGESVTEAVLAQWFKKDGDRVQKDEPIFLIETDKITLEVAAQENGIIHISVAEGETVAVGAVVGTIEEAAPEEVTRRRGDAETRREGEKERRKEGEKERRGDAGTRREEEPTPEPEKKEPPAVEKPKITPTPPPSPSKVEEQTLSPSVRRLVAERSLDPIRIPGTGPDGRITKGDVILHLEAEAAEGLRDAETRRRGDAERGREGGKEEKTEAEMTERKPMTPIRRRIAARLLEAKQNTAMLTTFNEIDMSRIQAFRAEHRESFKTRYGVSLGIMSFFIKASVAALREFPEVNAFIEKEDIVYHRYYHIGVAVGAERGLVVPVIRHADRLGFSDLEKAIVDFVKKIRENRLDLADLEGGTFTITNGGVFGSLLSTPILNMPQSGILGMHKIEDRPVAVQGEVRIRPMMYVAFSYDHRIIDGREAVSFLKRIKECIETPERMMVEI